MRCIVFLAALLPGAAAIASDFEPCGGKDRYLWAWGWAGEDGRHLTLEQIGRDPQMQRWSRMKDLSGNGRDFYNDVSTGPPFQRGYEWYCGPCPTCERKERHERLCKSSSVESYETALPVIGLNAFRPLLRRFKHLRRMKPRQYQYYFNVALQNDSMQADRGFYLVFAGMHGRRAGTREIFGSDSRNFLSLDQKKTRVYIKIDGKRHAITRKRAFKRGPIVLEVLRTDDRRVHVMVNGEDVSLDEDGVNIDGVFDVSGLNFKGGLDGTGHSYWDDGAFEYIMCRGEPPPGVRDATRQYLNDKWRIY